MCGLFYIRGVSGISKLTQKQQAFIDAYCSVSKMNATDAARRAGYKHPHVQGAQNLSKLSAEIAKRMEELKERSGSSIDSQQDLMEFFSAVRRGEETEKVVTNSGKVVELPVAMKDRIKAAELLGKSYGMFTDKHEVELTVPTFVDDVPKEDSDG